MAIFTVKMPDIGEGVVEGEIIEWLKKVGDPIAQDEPVLIVMTDKATVELPAPYPGILATQYYKVGEIAIKDHPLYDIEASVAIPATASSPKVPVCSHKSSPQATEKPIPSYGKALATPPIRKLARDLNIDLGTIPGTGNDGRVTLDDIKQQLQGSTANVSPVTAFPDDEIIPLVGIRKLMAEKMMESVHQAAHFSYFEQIDATRLVQLRQNIKKEAEKTGIRLTYMPLLIRALSLALTKFPTLNSSLDRKAQQLRIHKQHNIGIGMSTEHGLIVPVIKDVEKLSLEEIIRAYEELKEKAKNHKLLPQDMKDATITISNYGVLGGGGRWATPVLNYPEVAILAVARIQKQPVVKNDEIVIKDTLNLSWSFDHRVVDGDLAATFSQYYSNLLENPASLL